MNISEHITLLEATKSQTAIRLGIDNTPDAATIDRMKLVAETCFEPIRKHFGIPLKVSSFYRCKALNDAIKGSKTSQHMSGEAIDIDADGSSITNKEIHDWAKANLKFDQLINEFPDVNGNPAWVHISFSKHGNRNQCLIIK